LAHHREFHELIPQAMYSDSQTLFHSSFANFGAYIYSPGQNKRNTLFFQLFISTIVIRAHFYTTDRSSIDTLILKFSAL